MTAMLTYAILFDFYRFIPGLFLLPSTKSQYDTIRYWVFNVQ